MDVFKLHKPDISGSKNTLFEKLKPGTDLSSFMEKTNRPEYLFWNKVRYLPRPKGLTAEEFWALVKFFRKFSHGRVKTPIRDEQGIPFSWQSIPGLEYLLHEVDMGLGGLIESDVVDNQLERRKFIARGILEEAIASSQLEGANTTRKAAKHMIREKRKPVNKSEHMIINNYEAMVQIEDQLKSENLSLATLLDMHRTLTKNTIDSNDIGRLRRDSDEVVVWDSARSVIYHIPPSESFLKKEIIRFLDYSNDVSKTSQFTHPLIKAILLHFWIGYLHPFTDGNGRLARAIFYWYLLRKQYWGFSYLPLSRIIKRSPAQYRDAYVFSEQDDNDLTYFIDYNIRKIDQAKREFESYVKKKQSESRKMAIPARSRYKLNDRQIQLLRYLHNNPEATTTIHTHSNINAISRVTARKDLEDLEQEGFLTSQKVGKERPFGATEKIHELFS